MSPFESLSEGVAGFRARVEGREGDFRARLIAIPSHPSTGLTTIRTVLDVISRTLALLSEVVPSISAHLAQADALQAILDSVGAMVATLGGALNRNWPIGLAPAGEAGASLESIDTILGQATFEVPVNVPSPESLRVIDDDIRELLGTPESPGALSTLIAALSPS